MNENIVLIGFMAVGKGRTARALSKLTGRFCVDTDDLIESLVKMKIKKIFEAWGEPHFRELEKQTGQWLANNVRSTVISTGGGFFTVENLNDPQLQKNISLFLDKYDIQPQYIMLEITENGMMTNPGRSVEVLKQLSELGIRLSVDDFGTGFSSLSYLQRLPVHEVKIDKSFVMNMDANDSNKTIVESVITLGHNLGLSVVAEGIETNKVLVALKALNCNCGQGFLISKPVEHGDFIEWLKTNINQPIDIYPQEKT